MRTSASSAAPATRATCSSASSHLLADGKYRPPTRPLPSSGAGGCFGERRDARRKTCGATYRLKYKGIDPAPRGNRMHLSDLAIEGFRGIERLSIPRLGHVTLLAGRNGVGKTTVLDAVRLYAARGRPAILTELLNGREEFNTASDEKGGEILFPDLTAFFHGREMSADAAISIGPDAKDRSRYRHITTDELPGSQQKMVFRSFSEWKDESIANYVPGQKWLLPVDIFPDEIQFSRGRELEDGNGCSTKTNGSPQSNAHRWGRACSATATWRRFWDKIALTDSENLPLQALQLILGRCLGGGHRDRRRQDVQPPRDRKATG